MSLAPSAHAAPAPTASGGASADYILIRDEKASGTAGGTLSAGSWVTRDLTVVVHNEGNHAALSNNRITLQPGTYEIEVWASAFITFQHQIRIRNITANSTIREGSNEYCHITTGTTSTKSQINDKFTISVETEIEIQHRANTASAGNGCGVPTSWGTEVYCSVELRKVA